MKDDDTHGALRTLHLRAMLKPSNGPQLAYRHTPGPSN